MTHVSLLQLVPSAQKEFDQLSQWHHEVGMLGITRFGELGWRMTQLLESLSDAETESQHPLSTVQRAELESLVSKLHMSDPPFSNWDAPLRELTKILGITQNHHSMA